MKLSNLPEYYQKQVETKLKNEKINNRNTSASSNKKRAIRHEPLEEETFTRFDRPVSIIVRTTRRRETDHRAVEDKYFIDSLVTCGILRNDTKKDIWSLDVPEPSIGSDEKTIIEIEEC